MRKTGPPARHAAAAPAPNPSEPPDAARIDVTARLTSAFELAAGELGFATAASLFVAELASIEGLDGVERLRDALGRDFPVLHRIASRHLAGERAPRPATDWALAALDGIERLVVVGIEAEQLDALLERLDPQVRVGVVTYRLLTVDWGRVLANHGGRIEAVDLSTFQAWAGARSAVLTFAYGIGNERAHVLPAYLRVSGPDVHTQFRDFVAWDVLGSVPAVYPRWVVEIPVAEFTCVVPFDPPDDETRRSEETQ